MAVSNVSVVLAHGAWADGSSWSKVILGLHRAGVVAVAAPLPLETFEGDVAALDRTVERQGGRVVVVGHAYAGAVIGAVRSERVAGLVYVAALVPDQGETVADNFFRGQPHPQAPKVGPDDSGWIWLPDDAFATAFAPGASKDEQAVLAATQRPISPACITVPMGLPLWKSIPSWYLVAQQDVMIAAQNQEFMAQRMRAEIRMVDADHTPSVSAPDPVVQVILEAVKYAAA
jgi:pimeloyl-ACP methyl ester carboxylesterase